MMPTSTQELQRFQEYAAARIQNNGAKLDLEDLLDEWKHQDQAREKLHEDILAVKASLRDMESGETGTPAEDVIREFKTKYDLAGES
ncbi:MAG TPA: hypothetical protein PLR25_12700 [Planctomycetaceae bacterium]|nr:hypothetical protein [Planctomycetaceae bacterium]